MWEVLRFDFKNKQNPTNLLSLLDLSTDESALDDPKFILARFIENWRTFTSNEVLKVLNWVNYDKSQKASITTIFSFPF